MVESWLSTFPELRRSTRPALFLEQACCVSNNTFACKRSAAARKRNQVARGTRKAYSAGRLPISSTMQLNPPACSSRSLTFNPCSRRDHNLRLGPVFVPGAGNGVSCGPVCLCSGRGLWSASAQRGAVTAGPKRSLTAVDSPLDSMRGWPPPLGGKPGFTLSGFSVMRNPRCGDCGNDAVPVGTPQRIHRSRERSTPKAAADSGCSVSETSTQAHTLPSRVIPATNASASEVRPEHSGPTNLAERTGRESATKQGIDLANTRGSHRGGNTRQGSQRRGNSFRQVGFNLGSELLRGRHNESSPYFRLWWTSGANANCGKRPEKTDKGMKAKYLKIRLPVLD